MVLYTVTDAAKALGLSRKGVSAALIRGTLEPTMRTVGGLALFDEATLEHYRRHHLGRSGRPSRRASA